VADAVIKAQAQVPKKPEEISPKSFKEIVAANDGDTYMQRLAKWYIRHNGNPETTIKVLETLGVHRLQEKLRGKRSNNERKEQRVLGSMGAENWLKAQQHIAQ
jgi:hypothetical protein